MELRAVETQSLKGLAVAVGVGFRELIVTGPAGSGKTTFVSALAGWPEEGFLDLTQRGWWRSRDLAFRPREVHLGLPIDGTSPALAPRDERWPELAADASLQLDRIRLPAAPRWWRPWDSRKRFVFEFLLPSAKDILAARVERAQRGTHPADEGLSATVVELQRALYAAAALHLHRSGLRVYLRDRFGGPPMAIAEPLGDPAEPQGGSLPTRRAGGWRGILGRLLDQGERLEELQEIELVSRAVRIPSTTLPISITVNARRLRVYPQRPLAEPRERVERQTLVVFDADDYAEGAYRPVHLEPGARLRVTRDGWEEESAEIEAGWKPSKAELVHLGEELAVRDVNSSSGTQLQALSSPEESDRLLADRERQLRRVREIHGGPFRPLPRAEADETLEAVIAMLEASEERPRDTEGRPGGLLELPAELDLVFLGDLHGTIDNLLRVLSENKFMDSVEEGRAAIVLLGDLVHDEDDISYEGMESSRLTTDLTLKLMLAFPGRFLYLAGNHDSFSREVNKAGVPQGELWRQYLLEQRGERFAANMQRFYDLLPSVLVSEGLVACHGGPPLQRITREALIDLAQHPHLKHQLSWNRVRSLRSPSGYQKRDVQAFRQALGQADGADFVVAHNPQSENASVWSTVGGIANHFLVYSARRDQVSAIARLKGRILPLTYPAERLVDFAERLGVEGGSEGASAEPSPG